MSSTARYEVQVLERAEKELARLPANDRERLEAAITELAHNPRPMQSKKLQGSDHLYRIRVGSYRILYNVYDEHRLVVVVRIAHRKDAYR